MQKKWNIVEADVGAVEALAEELKINKILCQVIASRGITSAKEAKRFISAGLDELDEPLLMKGMKKAVQRIESAVANK